MRRTTIATALVAALLAPVTAAADVADGLCDEFGQMVEWTAPLTSPTTITASNATLGQWSTPAQLARTALSEITVVEAPPIARNVPLEAEDILWCLSPDDPRCSPVDDGHGSTEVKVRDAATANLAGDIARPFKTMLRPRGAAGGGPRPGHGLSLERPPQA